MALQNWEVISGTVYGNPKLSSKARLLSPKMTKLMDLVDPSEDFYLGKKSGDSISVRIVGDITTDATTPIGEFTPVPFSKPPVYHVTGYVYRYAMAIAWTGEYEDLDRLNVEDTNIQTMTKHAARTVNTLIYNELVTGRSFTYVCDETTSGSFLATGSVSATADQAFTLFHVQNIAKNLLKYNVPYADGESYIAAISPTLKFDLLKDAATNGFIDVKKYASGGAEGILRNEIGKVGEMRFVCDNADLPDNIGASSLRGSGFVVGWEGVKELMVYPLHFRFNGNLGGDFANQKGMAWQALQGYKTVFNYTAHGQGGVCHITSA